jgi:hypothetical protein
MLCRRAMSGRERPRTDHTLPLRPMTVVSCGTETQFQHQGPGQKGNLLATRRPSRSRRRRLAQTLGLYSKGTHSIGSESRRGRLAKALGLTWPRCCIVREHILSYENALYDKRTLYSKRTQSTGAGSHMATVDSCRFHCRCVFRRHHCTAPSVLVFLRCVLCVM